MGRVELSAIIRQPAQGAVGSSSEAGPGESNHQFGQALDVGYVGLRLIRPNGTIQKSSMKTSSIRACFLGKSQPYTRHRTRLGEGTARDGDVFRIRMHGGNNDPNHFQNFNQFSSLYPDPTVDIHASLVAFLSGISGFNWEKNTAAITLRPGDGIDAGGLGTANRPLKVSFVR